MTPERNKIKLTDKQKKIVRLMKDGYSLSVTTMTTTYNPTLKKGDNRKYAKMATITSLLRKAIISHAPNRYMGTHFYELTDMGRELPLD